PDAVRVVAVQARLCDCLLRGTEREQDVAVEPACLLRRYEAGRIEVLDLRRNPHGQTVGVEGADPVDAALAGHRGAPGLRRRAADRCDCPETRDGYPPHGLEAMRGRRPPAARARRTCPSWRRSSWP